MFSEFFVPIKGKLFTTQWERAHPALPARSPRRCSCTLRQEEAVSVTVQPLLSSGRDPATLPQPMALLARGHPAHCPRRPLPTCPTSPCSARRAAALGPGERRASAPAGDLHPAAGAPAPVSPLRLACPSRGAGGRPGGSPVRFGGLLPVCVVSVRKHFVFVFFPYGRAGDQGAVRAFSCGWSWWLSPHHWSPLPGVRRQQGNAARHGAGRAAAQDLMSCPLFSS